jgi:hypothetical protein
VTKDEPYAEVESVKAVSDVIAPLSGEIVEVNTALGDKPEAINEDPYGAGWLVRVKLSNDGEQGDLLDASWRDPAAVEAALARLRAELGPNVVVKPIARDSHAPERMGTWKEQGLEGATAEERGLIKERELHKGANGIRALTAEERTLHKGATTDSATADNVTAGSRSATANATAIRLLESPESVFVACDNGAPASVVWRGRRIAVERAMGPERLSGDWWDDGYRRDYWRCESAFGDFVLYLDRMDDQWWVQGWYD